MTLNRQTDYALQFLSALALLKEGESLPLSVFANKGYVSFLFMQRIVSKLRGAGLVVAGRGRSGGYRLMRAATDITVLDVAQALDGDMAVVPCLKDGDTSCPHASVCITRTSFHTMNAYIQQYLKTITISALVMLKAEN